MEVGGALVSVLFAAFSLPCLLLLVVLGEAGLRVAALALRGSLSGGGHAWPSRSAFLGYRIARPGGSSYSSVFRDDGEPPLPRECCDRLAVAVYRREHAGSEPEPECVFCLSAIRDGEEVRELRCRHVFHRACLDAWLIRPRATCPLCRDRLLPSDPPRACSADDGDVGRYLVDDDDLDLSSSSPAAASAYAHGGALWHMT
uniref:RING-type domain-containing protein n=1 Tax=Arundo donax TaxID=35708 RepID=A0A0A9FAY2_ARUDO